MAPHAKMEELLTVYSQSPGQLSLIIGGITLSIYWASLIVYRLYLSPLAKFPGPKLAGLTWWTEAYYELFKGDGGQFPFQYQKWHQKYGLLPGCLRLIPTR